MTFVPKKKDLLGACHPWATIRRAQNLSSKVIPNDETMVLMSWFDWPGSAIGEPPVGANGSMFLSVAPTLVAPTSEELSIVTSGPDQEVYLQTRANAALQRSTFGLANILGDHFLVGILDRDNALLQAWIDGALIDSNALIGNPDFSAASRSFLFFHNTAVRKVEGTIWRTSLLSLANGATPTEARWADMLERMRNPQALLHPQLREAKGSVYSNYFCGEGLDGSSVVVDQGDEGDDLTWQDGETCEDVRVRNPVPITIPKNTLFTLKPGYTAITLGLDFGFGALPVAARFLFDGMTRESAHRGAWIYNGAGTHFIRIEATAGVPRISVATGGAPRFMVLSDDQAENGGDVLVVCIGTAGYVIFNGQLVSQLALTAPLDLSVNMRVNLDGRSKCCSVQVYNETFTIEDIIELSRHVVQDPESWLGLTNNPLIDFTLQADYLDDAGTGLINRGDGGGILTLSDILGSACVPMVMA